ncbi:MAG: hypothetical protein ACO1G6_05725 [Bacteroidota bacterium]
MKLQKKKIEDQESSELSIDKDLPGYPAYPKSQDAYNKMKEETEIDPENITQNKQHLEYSDGEVQEEKDFFTNSIGSDLDVPGSELDDDAEDIGSEDEENNFYSLGDND